MQRLQPRSKLRNVELVVVPGAQATMRAHRRGTAEAEYGPTAPVEIYLHKAVEHFLRRHGCHLLVDYRRS